MSYECSENRGASPWVFKLLAVPDFDRGRRVGGAEGRRVGGSEGRRVGGSEVWPAYPAAAFLRLSASPSVRPPTPAFSPPSTDSSRPGPRTPPPARRSP